jgi:DNA polymerase (family 10)
MSLLGPSPTAKRPARAAARPRGGPINPALAPRPRGGAAKPKAKASLAETARRLAAIIGHGDQGAALARTLAREGVRTRADLKRPAVLARLPRESQAAVLFNPARNVPLATAQAVMDEVGRRLVFDFSGESSARFLRFEVIPVGSVRRQAPRVKDMDFLVVVPAAYETLSGRALAAARLLPPRPGDRVRIADTYAAGARRRSLILCQAPGPDRARAQCFRSDLFLTTSRDKPYALFHYTGSKTYNIRTRAYAKRKGWLLNQYGLFDAVTGRRVRGTENIRTEQDLAKFLGVSYRLPTNRER